MSPTEIVTRGARFPISKIDDTLIAIDRQMGYCYALNATAARVWELIASPTTIAAICDTLCLEFEVDRDTCEKDVIDILFELKSVGLVQ